MSVIQTDEWFKAQNQLLSICLLDCNKIPALLSNFKAADFDGKYRILFEAIAKLFKHSASNSEVDVVSLHHTMGGTQESMEFLCSLMEGAPDVLMWDNYLRLALDACKLQKLIPLGEKIYYSRTLDEAMEQVDQINQMLVARAGFKIYRAPELIQAFRTNHQENYERLPWPIPGMEEMIPTMPGFMIAIGARPSGGKTAWGLQHMWEMSKTKETVFISLETNQTMLFDTWNAFISGISMNSLMRGKLSASEWQRFDDAEPEHLRRKYSIVPAAGATTQDVLSIVRAARAEVVIIDYLQLLKSYSRTGSRYETITEISTDLHIMAQQAKVTVIALCQVTRKNPMMKDTPLDMDSVKESGQIEQDCDVMVMLDKYIDQDIRKLGVRCDRVIRLVKNKRGKTCRFAARFDGEYQTFSRVHIPNADLERVRAEQTKKKEQLDAPDDFEQLPMEMEVPF